MLRWIGGAVAAAVCIDGPFLVLAGRSMISMVVFDQVRRASGQSPGIFKRAADLGLATALLPNGPHRAWIAVAAISALVGAAIVLVALSIPAGRLPVVIFAAQFAEVLTAPTYYPFYADCIVPALCLAAGAALHALSVRYRLTNRSVSALAGALVLLAAVPLIRVEVTHAPGETVAAEDETFAPPGSEMIRKAATVRCVQATSPLPLILLNVLSHDLRNGCPQWVDVSGRTYSVDRGRRHVSRFVNEIWQRDILAYLLAGQQYVLVDTVREGLNSRTMAILRQGPVIARSPSFVLQRRIPQQGRAGTAPPR
jgi:hypothetical protein